MNPTMRLRAMKRVHWISDDQARNVYVIQQLWEEEVEGETYSEWRDLPVVDEHERHDEWPR